MCPARGNAISPLGSITPVRASFGSCNTEMLKVSPGFRVWALAPDTQTPRQSTIIRIRTLIPLISTKAHRPSAGCWGWHLLQIEIAGRPGHINRLIEQNVIANKFVRSRIDLVDRKNV